MFRASIFIIFGCLFLSVSAQEKEAAAYHTIDFQYFRGNITQHNDDIAHLITDFPSGFILGWNQRTDGSELWQQRFGYPDKGFTFIYQDMNNPILGENYSIYGHYNFYFLRRKLQFRIGQGVAYNTNPYDRVTNFRNNAYGSHILSSTLLMANYYQPQIFSKVGLQAGFSIIHYSNANFKAPNTSTNTIAFNLGLVYDLYESDDLVRKKLTDEALYDKSIKYNLVLRGGVNESDLINSGQYGFWIASFFAEKRIGKLSALQLGVDYFESYFLKDLIRFQAISFPENDIPTVDTDFRRVGVVLGHELFVNKLSVIGQLGYYLYFPYDFEGRVYNRLGLRRYLSEKLYTSVMVKAHGAKAEAVEFGIGLKL